MGIQHGGGHPMKRRTVSSSGRPLVLERRSNHTDVSTKSAPSQRNRLTSKTRPPRTPKTRYSAPGTAGAILRGEVRPRLHVRVPHGRDLASPRLDLAMHPELLLRVHEVRVAARAREVLRVDGVVAVRQVGDPLDVQRAAALHDEPAHLPLGVGLAEGDDAGDDLGIERGRAHHAILRSQRGASKYRSARSGRTVTTFPRSSASAIRLATTSAPATAAPAEWPTRSPSSRPSRSAISQPSEVGIEIFPSSSCSR